MLRFELPVSHRPDREGGQITDRHVPGHVVFDVALQRFGSSSLTFRVELIQNNHVAARLTSTLVRVDEDRTHSLPFTTA